MSEPPPGQVTGIVNAVRSLTLTNVLVIALLVLALGPAYVAWKIINDDQMLQLFMSSFEEKSMGDTDCSLRITSSQGSGLSYNVTLSFAFSGADRWYLGVHTPNEPTAEEGNAYCDALTGIILYIRGTGPNPLYPGTDRTIFPPPGLPNRPK